MPWPLAVPALIGVLFLLVPLVGLLVRAPWSGLSRILSDAGVTSALRLSLVCATAATAISLVLGVPLAWALARVRLRGISALRALVTLPLVLPPVVGGVALLLALGRHGLVGQYLDSWFGITLPFTTAGVVVAETFVAMPFLVLTVESALMDDLKKGADDYRRKDLFEFRAYNANRVELIRGKDVVVFERVKGQGENAQDKWRRVSPNAADADRDKVDAMLAKLANMRATSFVDGKAALSPALEIHVKFDDSKKEERITFVKDGADVLALRPGEPGAAKTDAADLTETLKSLDELSK